MLRPTTAFALGVCLGTAGVAQADAPAESAQTAANADKETEFKLLFEMAERERSAGRDKEAAVLYSKALELQPHPVIAGRLGLLLMKLGKLDQAGELLHKALERGQGVSEQERRAVAAAYDKAKLLTTWVNVDISHAGAKVTLDGEPQDSRGFSSFWMFAMPGEHKLRATLEGYEDATATFTGKPGEEITISLNFVRLEVPKLPELPRQSVDPGAAKRRFPPMMPTSNVATDPNYTPNEDPSYGEPKEEPKKKKTGPRFTVSGGVVTVFGVASWNPAVGPVLGVGLRPNDYFSLGLEGRAAWLTTGVAGGQIGAMTAGGIASACGHLRWFVGCGLGYLGEINISPSSNSYEEQTISRIQPGFGARAGVELRVRSAFLARGNVDVINVARGMQLAVGDRIIVDQPQVMINGQITGVWEF